MSRRLLAEQPEVNALIMPMGVDTCERFVPNIAGRVDSELLFVGRLVEKKGLHHLLSALPAVLASHPQVKLNIVGFGPERARLDALVVKLALQSHVRFLGALPQEALPEHYRRASLFVAPFTQAANGDQEGLGLVVAEAMACECPVVVGDVPAAHDLVSAETGTLVCVDDHAALACTINRLLDDPDERTRLGRAGRRHIEQNYSWQIVGKRYSDLLLDLASPGQP